MHVLVLGGSGAKGSKVIEFCQQAQWQITTIICRKQLWPNALVLHAPTSTQAHKQ